MPSNVLTTWDNMPSTARPFLMIENYIYMYHTNTYIVLPAFADSVQDVLPIRFNDSPILGRSAPIFSYQNSGPRSVQINLTLHRDLMTQINQNVSNVNLQTSDDYVDVLIKLIQASTVPDYDAASKAVNPPIVALRMGNDIFIKGVIVGNVGLTYQYPILSNEKYAVVSFSLTINEIDPYDARTVSNIGSYRNINTTLERTTYGANLGMITGSLGYVNNVLDNTYINGSVGYVNNVLDTN